MADCDGDSCSSTDAAGAIVTYLNTNTVTAVVASDASSSSTSGPRESAVTSVYTSYEVITSTNVRNSVFITSLPKSLYTRTTVVAADTTLVPVLTPSVIYTSSQFVVNTIINFGSTSLQTSTRVVTSSAAAAATTSSGAASASSSATSAAGAAQTMIPAAVGAIAMGFAALL